MGYYFLFDCSTLKTIIFYLIVFKVSDNEFKYLIKIYLLN